MNDSRLSGNVLNGDSTSPKRGALGTMFLDLGITVAPSKDFKLYAEFRMQNIIGNFNYQGNTNQNGISLTTTNSLVDSRMIFRQIRAEGIIKKIIHYQIGDIDLGLSKYTLFNNSEIFNDYEAGLYQQRREIPRYENFQTDNLWRLQGVSAKTQINLKGPVRRIDLNIFGARTKMNLGDNVPDRLIVGGKLEVLQSKYLTLGANWINMFDIPRTIYDSLKIPYNYNNNVLTGTYKITPYNKGKFELNILGESGFSKNKYFISSMDSTSKKHDYFIDAGIKALYKPKKIQLTVSYINIGQDFTSPGAQTLCLLPTQSPLYFSKLNNGTTTRPLTIYDRLSDETIYNLRINPGLMKFIPVYGNVLPYGAATPNRSGIIYNIGRTIDTSNVLSYNVGGAFLTELVSEGDSTSRKLRKFVQVKGGITINISKLTGSSKTILFSVGGRYENTTRDGSASVNFSSVLADAGLTLEIFKNFYLMGGTKYLHGNGTEVITQRDIFGSISGYTPYNYNVDQLLVSGGLKLALFKNSFASVEYNRLMITDHNDSKQNYTLGNLLINFTLRY